MKGVHVSSLAGELRPDMPWGQNQNIKQKQYCNKFNKDFTNGSHQKIFLKKHALELGSSPHPRPWGGLRESSTYFLDVLWDKQDPPPKKKACLVCFFYCKVYIWILLILIEIFSSFTINTKS